MGATDRTEKVLRDIHVLFSKAKPYNGSKKDVIVDKNEMMELLKELNNCMYEMQDEYDLSVIKKDKANREMQKQGDDIIFEATRKAEDIYAASIMYTDNALNNIIDIMKEANKSIEKIYKDTDAQLKKEQREVKANQLDLKSQLNDLIDTQKYLRLIEDENRRLEKAKEAGSEPGISTSSGGMGVAPAQPEIRINKDYFIQNGIPLDDAGDEKPAEAGEVGMTDERIAAMQAELDNEYFDWKEGEEPQEEKASKKGGFPFFGKK